MKTHALGLGVVLAGWMTAACVPPDAAQPPVRPQVTITTPDRVTFETVDVELSVSHPREQDTDFVVVEVLTPKGHTHLRRELPLGEDGRATLTMPVRGTHIEDRAMAGQWSVLATYNHASTPFAAFPLEIHAR